MEKIPETWDWVQHRAKCSIREMFMLLIERIESDVAEVGKLNPGESVQFSLKRVADTKAVVVRRDSEAGYITHRAVIFEIRGGELVVAKREPDRAEQDMFTAAPMFGADGRCRFQVVGGSALELWQVSHRALDGLFFHTWS